MDLEVPTTSAPNLWVTLSMFCPYTYRWGDEIPKRGETSPTVWSPGSAQKAVYVMQFLMKGKNFFKAHHIYIWKADNNVA